MEANKIENIEIKDLEKEDLDNYYNFIQIKKQLNQDGQKDFFLKKEKLLWQVTILLIY